MTKSILETLKVFLLAAVLSICTMYAYAEWSSPSASPPSNNAPSPINVGTTAQLKWGNFGAANITAVGEIVTNNGAIRAQGANGNISASKSIWATESLVGKYIVAANSITLGGVARSSWPGGGVQTRRSPGNVVTCGEGHCTHSVASCSDDESVVGGGVNVINWSCGWTEHDHRHLVSSVPEGNTWTARYQCAQYQAFAVCAKKN